jgi:hypothetical protein
MQDQTPSQEQDPRLLVVLGTLLGFASISTDLYCRRCHAWPRRWGPSRVRLS